MSDSMLTLEQPSDDLRGRAVFGSDDKQIGKVDDLFIDEQDRKARFLLVHSGGFLGLGSERFLIPVDAIERIDEKSIHLGHESQQVAGSPKYDPAIVDDEYYTSLYGYYGYGPYWGPGYYIYPVGPHP